MSQNAAPCADPTPHAATVHVANLAVSLGAADILRGVSIDVRPGETLGLVGESGSGKSTLCRGIAGILPDHAAASGEIHIHGRRVPLRRHERGSERARVGYVFQSPEAALNPCLSIRRQLTEHLRMTGKPERERIVLAQTMLDRMRIADPAGLMRRYPHELSGGQQQRVSIAIALLTKPDVLILDEPTTALDVTTQAAILDLLREILRDLATAVIYVSHDLRVVAAIASRVAVMYRGQLVEAGTVDQVLRQPNHAYTRSLLGLGAEGAASRPGAEARVSLVTWRATPARAATSRPRHPGASCVEVAGLVVQVGRRRPRRIVLRNAEIDLRRGWTVALVGESGAGKSTFARALIGLTPAHSGTIRFRGQPLPLRLDQRTQHQIAAIQMVFQSSAMSLNPSRSAGTILRRTLRRLAGIKGRDARDHARRLLEKVRLPPSFMERRPGTLSGGERQRVAIARALAANPDVIILDEAVSALDSHVQAAILELLRATQEETSSAYLFISHDLAVVGGFADEVLVLYGGEIVERGPTAAVIDGIHHPYTEVLVRSIPGGLPLAPAALAELEGRASPRKAACVFALRCPWRIGPVCFDAEPPRRALSADHWLRCHHEEGTLAGLLADDRAHAEAALPRRAS